MGCSSGSQEKTKSTIRLEDTIGGEAVVVEFRRAIDDAADVELVQMAIGPTKGGLEHLVELGTVERHRQLEGAANPRFNSDNVGLPAHDVAVGSERVEHVASMPRANGVGKGAAITARQMWRWMRISQPSHLIHRGQRLPPTPAERT